MPVVRPPPEVREPSHRPPVLVESEASRIDGFYEMVEVAKVAIGHAFVDERPEAFGWLQLWRVGRQEHQVDPVGHLQVRRCVPSGFIEHQEDSLVGTGADYVGEVGEHDGHRTCRDAGADDVDRLSRLRLDEGVEVAPLVETGGRRDRPMVPSSPATSS